MSKVFTNSDVSNKIFKYFSEKYGQMVAPVGLLKVLATLSPFVNNDLPNLNILHVAPSRQFKTQLSREARDIVGKGKWIDLGIDVTMNSILERFRKGETANLGRKALFLDDLAILLTSKTYKAKERLIGGLTALLSDGVWSYGERNKPFLVLEGKVSLIANLTLEKYERNKNTLFSSTFHERFLTVFYSLPETEINSWLDHKDEKLSIKWNEPKISIKPREIENWNEYKKTIIDYAERFSVLSLKSKSGQFDLICALLKTHANLNNRNYLCEDDFNLLKKIEPYLVDPLAPNESKIVRFYKEGHGIVDILKLLGKPASYRDYVERVLRKAKERGIIGGGLQW